ncbi:MAG: hypothetical protein LBT55_00505 [Clostridiaceae bacterium]|jgi:hypothetical protein|nr:hypothetical protein [Clostridiaceae bacterium]
MRYLFFDIECSDGAHMCTFGYVLCDGAFGVLEKRDIVMNPEAQFQLGRYSGDPEITLAYSKERFLRSAPFPAHYEDIKRVLTAENQIVAGHSVDSDIGFINTACERYGFDTMDYEAMDTQTVFKSLHPEAKSFNLSSICQQLGVEQSNWHKSCDDAEATMRIAEKLCAEKETNMEGLAELFPHCRTSSASLSERRAVNRERKYRAKLFADNAFKVKPVNSVENAALNGKRVTFSRALENDDPLFIWGVLQEVVNGGGIYSRQIEDTHIFVKHGEKECGRYLALKDGLSAGTFSAQIIEMDALLQILNKEREEIILPNPDDYKLNEKKPAPPDVRTKGAPAATLGDILRAVKKPKR